MLPQMMTEPSATGLPDAVHIVDRSCTAPMISVVMRAYPAMKSASLFFVDFLIKDPKTGYLVSCPSHSPEQTPPNRPLLTRGPTMDNQLLRVDHLTHLRCEIAVSDVSAGATCAHSFRPTK